jgi:RNA-splicing ligase RtcB
MMIHKSELIKISDYHWEVPPSVRSDMRVPAHIFASEELLGDILQDRTVSQIINVTTLPGIEKAAIVMPDGHEGYGFPIGGVAAFRETDGVISPGGIGYDINCGVRLLISPVRYQDVKSRISLLTHELTRMIPKGMGRGGKIILPKMEIDQVLIPGSMGTYSWVLAGADAGMVHAFGSTCHGAGRRLSRKAAKKEINAPNLRKELELQGISVEAGSWAGLAEEAPIAYKDVDLVVETVQQAGLAVKAARLRPVGVIKG